MVAGSEDHLQVHKDHPTALWRPLKNQISALQKFRELINSKFGLGLRSYSQLYSWSVAHHEDFWREFIVYSGMRYSGDVTDVVEDKPFADVPRWFPGVELNFADNILAMAETEPNRVALYCAGERSTNDVEQVTFGELKRQVINLASALRKLGVKKGDRVVGYLPNSRHAIEAALATAAIGAVWSCTSPDFGVSGVLDRFTQIAPSVIFSVNAVVYNGRVHDHTEKLVQVVQNLQNLKKVVVVHYVDEHPLDISQLGDATTWHNFCETATQCEDLVCDKLPFHHPLYIMYSSGTTGQPKCMIHSSGGTLIQHLKEHKLHGNMTSDDVLFYYTTSGWMMWNWMLSALALGSSVVLYNGSPLKPTDTVMWDIIDKLKVTIFGTSAKYIALMDEKGVKPKDTHSLNNLRMILSTGSTLVPASYEYVYREVKADLILGSITGGTDIISCFAGHNSDLPVYKGEIQGRNLGMAVECWGEDGKIVFDERGELVCTRPFPSMPVGFWNDASGKKYLQAYFDNYRNVWFHGDFCMINKITGGIVMLGRSDGTLNPSGVRFGSAEIYQIVEKFNEVADSVCIAQRATGSPDERVLLFLKLVEGVNFTQNLVKKLQSQIRAELSARHVPAVILECPDIPYTLNGKKVEVAVRDTIAGKAVKNGSSLANAQALDFFRNVPALEGY